uniref:Cytochrome b5 domain-containing protein 1 n=1 Tax=Tetraodon nigroviridis TaxID=99883 RepID=H3CAK1_TETNG
MESGRPRFFTPAEVAAHDTVDDLWVSCLGQVCDLSPLAERYRGDALLLPILESAGADVSHWFDPQTGDVRRCVDPLTPLRALLHPQGPLRARAPGRPVLRLGHGHRAALVGGPALPGGTAVGQDPLGPGHQRADVTGAEAPGVFGGDGGGDPAAVPVLQRSRPQLHLETRGRGAGHEQDSGGERRPRRRPRAAGAASGSGPVHPGHPAPLQRRPDGRMRTEVRAGGGPAVWAGK